MQFMQRAKQQMTVLRALDAKDLVRVCTAWGFDVQIAVFEPLT